MRRCGFPAISGYQTFLFGTNDIPHAVELLIQFSARYRSTQNCRCFQLFFGMRYSQARRQTVTKTGGYHHQDNSFHTNSSCCGFAIDRFLPSPCNDRKLTLLCAKIFICNNLCFPDGLAPAPPQQMAVCDAAPSLNLVPRKSQIEAGLILIHSARGVSLVSLPSRAEDGPVVNVVPPMKSAMPTNATFLHPVVGCNGCSGRIVIFGAAVLPPRRVVYFDMLSLYCACA